MLCNPAYVNNVSTTVLYLDGRTRLLVINDGHRTFLRGVSKNILYEVIKSFQYLLSGSGAILLEVTIESRSTILKSFQLSRKPRNVQWKVHNILHSFWAQVKDIFICPDRKVAIFKIRWSFTRLHSMPKESSKISPFHVTLKAIVKIVGKFVWRKHVPVEIVLLILVMDPYYCYHKIYLLPWKKAKSLVQAFLRCAQRRLFRLIINDF